MQIYISGPLKLGQQMQRQRDTYMYRYADADIATRTRATANPPTSQIAWHRYAEAGPWMYTYLCVGSLLASQPLPSLG